MTKTPSRNSREWMSHNSSLRRGVGRRPLVRKILVVTNGERTEVDYFRALGSELGLTAILTVKFKSGAPITALRSVERLKIDNVYDEIFFVSDVDEFNVPDTAREFKRASVDLIWSRPCFEVWLLLHCKEGFGHLADATQAGQALARALGLKKWRKTDLNFADFCEGVDAAATRAKDLGDAAIKTNNPASDVWRVIEAIR